MTSSIPDGRDVFVWVWLPLATEPVVAGRLVRDGARFDFVYGRSYLERGDAIPLYLPELPLGRGVVPPPARLELAGCLRDGLPDAWGRRVLIERVGARGHGARDVELDDVTYMLESSSNRTGALDFQASADRYVPRDDDGGTLEDLEEAARRVERGEPVPEALARALFHGSSIGGARPKAVLRDGRRQLGAEPAVEGGGRAGLGSDPTCDGDELVGATGLRAGARHVGGAQRPTSRGFDLHPARAAADRWVPRRRAC